MMIITWEIVPWQKAGGHLMNTNIVSEHGFGPASNINNIKKMIHFEPYST